MKTRTKAILGSVLLLTGALLARTLNDEYRRALRG